MGGARRAFGDVDVDPPNRSRVLGTTRARGRLVGDVRLEECHLRAEFHCERLQEVAGAGHEARGARRATVAGAGRVIAPAGRRLQW